MQRLFALAEETRQATNGYFDIYRDGMYDPSGLVKGWAIYNAANMLAERGYWNYYVDAGGDIQAAGHNAVHEPWQVGIRSPFNSREVVKVLSISDCGVATSGTYVRGQHIYNPRSAEDLQTNVLSLTVIGPNVYDADRFATAAFAMGALKELQEHGADVGARDQVDVETAAKPAPAGFPSLSAWVRAGAGR